MTNVCEICFDSDIERLPLKVLQTINGDVIRSDDCGHQICKKCMAAYIASRVEEQRVRGICCPMAHCKTRLYDQDVEALVGEDCLTLEVLDRFAEIRSRDYAARAKDLRSAVYEMVELACEQDRSLWETFSKMRLCPRCSVVIQKSDGCNSFGCVCGHTFDFGRAPRVVPGSPERAMYFVRLARACNISVAEALEHYRGRKDFYKAAALAGALGVSRADAAQLLRASRNGDDGAREQIRRLRRDAAEVSTAPVAEAAEGEEAMQVWIQEDDPAGRAAVENKMSSSATTAVDSEAWGAAVIAAGG